LVLAIREIIHLAVGLCVGLQAPVVAVVIDLAVSHFLDAYTVLTGGIHDPVSQTICVRRAERVAHTIFGNAVFRGHSAGVIRTWIVGTLTVLTLVTCLTGSATSPTSITATGDSVAGRLAGAGDTLALYTG
jgi:hypothetical protein